MDCNELQALGNFVIHLGVGANIYIFFTEMVIVKGATFDWSRGLVHHFSFVHH